MKKILITLVAVSMLVTAAVAQETSETTESKSIGLSFGVDYWSTYIWRGQNFYGDQGVFFPWISYAVGDTGLSFSVAGEYSDETLGDDASSNKWGNAIDLAVAYEKSVAKTVTIGANVWYFGLYNSKDEIGDDISFITGTLSVALDTVPLTPTISYSHDVYFNSDMDETNKDFYIALALGHDIDLVKGSTLSLGCNLGYYNAKSADAKGISDFTLSSKVSTTAGAVTLYGSLNYTFVPSKDHYEIFGQAENKHKWWSAFGVSYEL